MRQSFLLLLLLLNLTVSFSELTRAEQPATGLASESKSSPTFKTVKVHRHLQHTDKTAFRQGAPAKADEARMLISTPNLSKAESLLRVNQKNMAALKRDPTVIKQMQRLDNNPAIQAGIKNIRKNPVMVNQLKRLLKNPGLIRTLQKPPSKKTAREANRYLSKVFPGGVSVKTFALVIIFGLIVSFGTNFGIYYLSTLIW